MRALAQWKTFCFSFYESSYQTLYKFYPCTKLHCGSHDPLDSANTSRHSWQSQSTSSCLWENPFAISQCTARRVEIVIVRFDVVECSCTHHRARRTITKWLHYSTGIMYLILIIYDVAWYPLQACITFVLNIKCRTRVKAECRYFSWSINMSHWAQELAEYGSISFDPIQPNPKTDRPNPLK